MRPHTVAILAVALAATLWGTTGVAAAYAPGVSAVAIGAGAMGFGGLLQALVNSRQIARGRAHVRTEWQSVTIGALCVVIYPLAFYSAMRVGGVALGNVVSLASAPLASAVIERALDGRRLTLRWLLAAGCGVAGATLLCVSHAAAADAPGTGSALVGVLLGLVAGITYAGYSRSLRGLMAHGVSRRAATGSIFGMAAVVLVPIFLVVGGAAVASAPRSAIVIAYLAIVPMFGGYLLFGYGLGQIDATTATTVTLIEPAVATVAAVLVLGEQLTAPGWLGIGLLAAALTVLLAARGTSVRGTSARAGPLVTSGPSVDA